VSNSFKIEVLESHFDSGLPALLDIYSIAARTRVSPGGLTLWMSTYPLYVDTIRNRKVKERELKAFQGTKYFEESCSFTGKYNRRKNDAYLECRIPKRTAPGEPQNYRKIQIPCPHLKQLQRRLLDTVFNKFPLGPEVMAFREGTSIFDNAKAHAGGSPLTICIDIHDFFPSITQKQIYYVLGKYGYSHEVCQFLSEIVTFHNFLPQGAPTSPVVANIVGANTFDPEVRALALQYNLVYTRYADDLAFSMPPGEDPSKLDTAKVLSSLTKILEKHGFRVNHRKTKVRNASSSKQMVTGLIVNNNAGSIPETWEGGSHPYAVRVPMRQYMLIHHVVYNCEINGIGREYNRVKTDWSSDRFISWVKGKLNFMKQAEQNESGLSPRIAKLEKRWQLCLRIWDTEKEELRDKGIMTRDGNLVPM